MEEQNLQYKPENYMVLAIFCTVCCCLPAGIYSIVKANDVNTFYAMGRYQEALKASAEAKKWSIIGIIVSAVIWALYLLFYLVVFVFAYANNGI